MHGQSNTPSEWVCRWLPRIAPGARVLDVACGSGRHARVLADRGFAVWAVDRDRMALAALADLPSVSVTHADLEQGAWPFPGERFGAIVVTNYLHRPLLPILVDSLETGGTLIYETFAHGNARFGRPTNPAFLLQPGELLEAVRGRLRVVAYEALDVQRPRPAAVQRICALHAPA